MSITTTKVTSQISLMMPESVLINRLLKTQIVKMSKKEIARKMKKIQEIANIVKRQINQNQIPKKQKLMTIHKIHWMETRPEKM